MIYNFSEKKCVACEGGVPPLDKATAEKYITETPGWTLSEDGKQISRTFEFEDFKEAIGFVNKVASIAEEEGHHPDIHIFWNKVKLDLSTHAIKGLSENDFILAAKVSKL